MASDEMISPTRRQFLVGAAGVIVVIGANKVALAQDEGDGTGEAEDGSEQGGDGEGEGDEGDAEDGGGSEEVIVGPGGDFVFDPEELTIEPGTTIIWTWDSDNHNVNPTEQPDEAEWEGHVDIENAGFEYEFTFDVEGEYHYICDPHVAQGMEGDVIVGAETAEGGEDSGPVQTVPSAASTLLIATIVGMIITLSFAYVFLTYGGR